MLFKLKDFLDRGILSQSEFETEKSKVLSGRNITVEQLEELGEMKKLFDAGIISYSDFETQKKEILIKGSTTISQNYGESNTKLKSNFDNKDKWVLLLIIVVTVIVGLAAIALHNEDSSIQNEDIYEGIAPTEYTISEPNGNVENERLIEPYTTEGIDDYPTNSNDSYGYYDSYDTYDANEY